MVQKILVTLTAFFILAATAATGFAYDGTESKTAKRAKKGGLRSGIIGMAMGGPQRAVVSAAAGAAGNVAVGNLKDSYDTSQQPKYASGSSYNSSTGNTGSQYQY